MCSLSTFVNTGIWVVQVVVRGKFSEMGSVLAFEVHDIQSTLKCCLMVDIMFQLYSASGPQSRFSDKKCKSKKVVWKAHKCKEMFNFGSCNNILVFIYTCHDITLEELIFLVAIDNQKIWATLHLHY